MPDGYGTTAYLGADRIGGGVGYSVGYTTGDYICATRAQLLDACAIATVGEVIYVSVPIWLLEADLYTEIDNGVIIASNRHVAGSGCGAICFADMSVHWKHLLVVGEDVKFCGLILQGPDPNIGESGADPLVVGIRASYGATGLEIENCELRNWTHAAVQVNLDGVGAVGGAGYFHVHHSLFHHNRRDGIGYGVDSTGGSGLIEANIFDFGRHAIAGQRGFPATYLETRYNIFKGNFTNTIYDQHGGNDSQAWGNPNPPDPDCPAGGDLRVHHNDFETATQACAGVRGIPYVLADFYRNVTWWQQSQSMTAFKQRLENLPGHTAYENMLVRDNWFASGPAPGGAGTTYYIINPPTDQPQPPPDYGDEPPYSPPTPTGPGGVGTPQIARPTADLWKTGSYTYYPAAPATFWSKVDEEVADEDDTYVKMTTGGFQWCYLTIPNFTLPSNAVNITVMVHLRMKKTGANTPMIIGGVRDDVYPVLAVAAGDGEYIPSTLWNDFTYTLTENNIGAPAPWTPEAVNAITILTIQQSTFFGGTAFTLAYVEVTYDLADEPIPVVAVQQAPSGCAGPYSLVVYGVGGYHVAAESCFIGLRIVKHVNTYAESTMVFYGNADIVQYLSVDAQIQIWRSNPLLSIAPYKEAEVFHRSGQFDWDEHAQARYTSRGLGYEHLLERRILLGGDDETLYAGGVFPAERVIKEIVKCQCGLAGTRAIDPGNPVQGLSVEYSQDRGDTWAGYRKGENLLAYIKEIAVARGMALKVVSPAPSTFVFQAYPNPYGADRTAMSINRTTGRNAANNLPIVFSEQRSNVSTIGYHSLRDGEGNVAIDIEGGAVQAGAGATASPWNRCEFVITLSDDEVSAEVAAEALEKMAAREEVPIKVIQTRECCYGRHYFLGDEVTVFVSARGIDKVINCTITGVIIEVSRSEGQLDEKITLELSTSTAQTEKNPVKETMTNLHQRLRKVELRT